MAWDGATAQQQLAQLLVQCQAQQQEIVHLTAQVQSLTGNRTAVHEQLDQLIAQVSQVQAQLVQVQAQQQQIMGLIGQVQSLLQEKAVPQSQVAELTAQQESDRQAGASELARRGATIAMLQALQ